MLGRRGEEVSEDGCFARSNDLCRFCLLVICMQRICSSFVQCAVQPSHTT